MCRLGWLFRVAFSTLSVGRRTQAIEILRNHAHRRQVTWTRLRSLTRDHPIETGLSRTDTHSVTDPAELRAQIARSLEERSGTIVDDAVAVCAFAGMEGLGAADRSRLIGAFLQLLTHAVRDAALDARSADVAKLRQVLLETALDIRTIFSVVYLLERSSLGELAVTNRSTRRPRHGLPSPRLCAARRSTCALRLARFATIESLTSKTP